MFDNQLPAALKRLPFNQHLSLQNVRKVVSEADGYQPHLIAPEQGYRRLIDGSLGFFKGPAEASVDAVDLLSLSLSLSLSHTHTHKNTHTLALSLSLSLSLASSVSLNIYFLDLWLSLSSRDEISTILLLDLRVELRPTAPIDKSLALIIFMSLAGSLGVEGARPSVNQRNTGYVSLSFFL